MYQTVRTCAVTKLHITPKFRPATHGMTFTHNNIIPKIMKTRTYCTKSNKDNNLSIEPATLALENANVNKLNSPLTTNAQLLKDTITKSQIKAIGDFIHEEVHRENTKPKLSYISSWLAWFGVSTGTEFVLADCLGLVNNVQTLKIGNEVMIRVETTGNLTSDNPEIAHAIQKLQELALIIYNSNYYTCLSYVHILLAIYLICSHRNPGFLKFVGLVAIIYLVLALLILYEYNNKKKVIPLTSSAPLTSSDQLGKKYDANDKQN